MAKKNGKQLKIAGTGRDESTVKQEIERAAVRYVSIRDQRMALTKDEVKAQAELLTAMQKHSLTEYVCDEEDLRVEVVDKVKARVRRRDDDAEQAEA